MPDIEPLLKTITYLNLSFNDFRVSNLNDLVEHRTICSKVILLFYEPLVILLQQNFNHCPTIVKILLYL